MKLIVFVVIICLNFLVKSLDKKFFKNAKINKNRNLMKSFPVKEALPVPPLQR
jgi:hypothetical protein